MTLTKSIELDCPPGLPRPGDLIVFVIEGLGLTLKGTTMRLFGNWEWEFPEVSDERWKEIKPILKKRILTLFSKGLIRYGSW